MEDAYCKKISEVVAHFNVDVDQGLTDDQVVQGQKIHGKNELAPDEGTPLWRLILKQFDDLLVKILIVAAVVDFLIALFSGETGVSAFVEPGVIFLILLANATVGVITEGKAEKAIEMLKAYEAEDATVVRHGHVTRVPAVELVPGDVVEVAVGAKIPADCRVIQLLTNSLRVDQSILTGESNSVDKSTDAVAGGRKAVYQDMTCVLFSGTVVTAGRCRALVVSTGQSTAIGKIRDAMVEAEEDMTPLKRKLDEFGTFLSKVIAVICVLVWVINIPHFNDPMHGGWVMGALYYFKIAVALAVAAIPEGLPAVVTTCLALGTRKMAQRNAIVRSLPSVETLGCTTVICSDKTGTLTTNRMAVAKVALVGNKMGALDEFVVTGNTFSPEGKVLDKSGSALARPAQRPAFDSIARCCSLCNDSVVYYEPKINGFQSVGEATEVALRILAEKIGVGGEDSGASPLAMMGDKEQELQHNKYWQCEYPRVAILEFNRKRKMMSTLNAGKTQTFMFVKGAPENVLSRCKEVVVNDGSGTVPLAEQKKSAILALVEQYGRRDALRCLALAMKTVPHGKTEIRPEDESDLVFLGIVGMHDPPREEIAGAMDTCRQAGIRVIVVTGDNLATAEAVCRQIGIMDGKAGKVAYTGVEFEELDAVSQSEAVSEMCVFARVEPAHKSKLIELLKGQGHIVAMTGDGVNDAPALKKADIGVAMGSGTAVAKHAADMVLADDNFASIVSAVEEGRAIYNNTKQFIRYMVSSNIGEVVAIFFAALVGMPETLNPVQLLWVNLVTDGLPATALGFNKPDANIMRVKPRRKDEGIVDRWLFVRYLVIGMYVGCVTVAGFAWWYMFFEDGPRLSWKELTAFNKCVEGEQRYTCDIFADRRPSTVSMSVLVVVEMFNALNALSENASLLQLPPWSNRWLLGAIALSMLLHVAILYIPMFATMFSVAALSRTEWLAIVWLSFPVILLDELLKVVSRNVIHKRRPSSTSGGRSLSLRSLLKKNSNVYESLPKDEV